MASRRQPEPARQTRAERRAAARQELRAKSAPAPSSRLGRLARRWAMPAVFAGAGVAAVAIVANGLMAPPKPTAKVVRPAEGSATAAVLVAEYSDYQCDYCGRWAREIESSFRSKFITTGAVRFEWHDYAWEGQESIDAANAARCAGDQDQFWPMHDLLYASQNATPNTGAYTKDKLKSMGASLGLDPAAFNACIDAGTYNDAVRADGIASQRAVGSGTPAFVIGGQVYAGYQTLDQLTAAVQAAAPVVSASPAAVVP